MRRLAATDGHPAQAVDANERRRSTRREQRAAELAWEAEHPEPADRTMFQREVLPRLQCVSARGLSRATGLSVAYCAQVKRGERVPHPRWWATLESLGRVRQR